MAPSAIRDRIVELRRVRASELAQNPRNWRRHPPEQARALRSVLEQVGYADALLARETPEGLELIDGHLRAETTPDAEVPVLVLDVTQAEADLILVTLDPLTAMAETDAEALEALLASVSIDSAELAEHLAGLHRQRAQARADRSRRGSHERARMEANGVLPLRLVNRTDQHERSREWGSPSHAR